MNYPREQVPGLLRELMRGREEGDELEVMDCFGSMRVKWLEVHCADGLQVGLYPACTHYCTNYCGHYCTHCCTRYCTHYYSDYIQPLSLCRGCCDHDSAEWLVKHLCRRYANLFTPTLQPCMAGTQCVLQRVCWCLHDSNNMCLMPVFVRGHASSCLCNRYLTSGLMGALT